MTTICSTWRRTLTLWSRFGERQNVDFPIGKDQLFVMGDNSAESSDARLVVNWRLAEAQPGRRVSG